MFTQLGFLGTRAPMYIDIVAIVFFMLPLMLFISIRFAIKKDIKKHLISQVVIFTLMLISVIVFEVGMRMAGGFTGYLEASSVNHTFFTIVLIVHILTAIVVINAWSYQLITAIKGYRKGTLVGESAASHRRIGKIVSAGILITLIEAAIVYYLLFSL